MSDRRYDRRPDDRPEAPDAVELFRRLDDARRRRDAAEGRRLTVELRRAGWTVIPHEPAGAGRGRP